MTKKNFCVRDAKGIISVYPISFDKDKIRLYREISMTEALKDEHSNYTYNDEIFYSSDILFGKPTAAKLDQ